MSEYRFPRILEIGALLNTSDVPGRLYESERMQELQEYGISNL